MRQINKVVDTRCPRANEGKSSLDGKAVRAFPALHSVWSKKRLVPKKQREKHYMSDEEKQQWIQHYVERETAGAWKWVEDAEAPITQEQDDTETAENAGLRTREPKRIFQDMMVTIEDNLSNLASSNDGEDG